jgi:transcription-repair coupling factor (superfamily II helicase)
MPKEDSKKVQFAPDSYLQNELESSFIYEDTPDQTKSTAEVKPIWKVTARWIAWFVEM